MIENLDRRALGAIEFVDAVTAVRLRAPLRIAADDERLVIAPNVSSLYVIRGAPGLEAHTTEFERPPATPAFGAREFALEITDPAHRYLPRATRIRLPRKFAPASDADSVLNPVVVPLYPAAAAVVAPGWAVLRLLVTTDDAAPVPLANAIVIATPQPAGIAAVTAVSDARGEALVVIPGVPPVLAQGAGPVLLSRQFDCALEIVVDRRVVTRAPLQPLFADPESIARDRTAGHVDVAVFPQPQISLSAGASARRAARIHLP